MVVGAADESDWDIYKRITQLYGEWGFKRVYYQPFRPARYIPLEEHPATPMIRAHRLYQMDWLSRIYGYSQDEMRPAFDQTGNLSLDIDPKLMLALDQLEDSPVDINNADYSHLILVPGIGPTSANRILAQQMRHRIDAWRDLQAMGVVVKRAKAFVGFSGYRPEKSKQLKLDMFQEGRTADLSMAHGIGGCSTCNTGACAVCPVAGLRGPSPLTAGSVAA